jgi:Family of unknown function (DUF5906)
MDEIVFDGDAISRADRDFLANLDKHPLKQNPLYGAPCLPVPDFGEFKPKDKAQQAARKAFFVSVVDWMLVNYAYCKSAFIGKGGIISLVSSELGTIAGMRGFMQPYALLDIGPRNGIKTKSVVDAWMMHSQRMHVDAIQTRSDQLRPTFEENGQHVVNRYRPPAHPKTGGNTAAFHTFLAHLFPDEKERKWYWHRLAHKVRKPWIPMIGVIMVAEEFGSGRGTLFNILELLFGKKYVVPCSFGELTGRSAGARFNLRKADALFLVVNEAVSEDGAQQAYRRLDYEGLKNAIEPSPTAQHRVEPKGQEAYTQTLAGTVDVSTNHRDAVKLPPDDRRIGVLICGPRMSEKQAADIRTWMADPANIGALYRELLSAPAAPLSEFDPFGVPPMFAGRREMIGMGRSKLEDAYDAAIEALEGCPLFTMPQAQRLISYIAGGAHTGGGDSERIRHTVAKNAYRLRQRDEPNNRIKYHKRPEVLYARTGSERQRWREADRALIIKQLDRAEERITQVINAEHDVLADLLRRRGSPESGG